MHPRNPMCEQCGDELLEDVRRKLKESEDAFNLFEALHMAELEDVRYKFVDLRDSIYYFANRLKHIRRASNAQSDL